MPDDQLAKVISEFDTMCKKYVGLARNMEGCTAAKDGHMTQATKSWVQGSELGYSKSQFNLGLCYETGQGVKKDLKKVM